MSSTTTTTIPDITLYYANGACSRVPHILLTELRIPFSTVRLDLTTLPSGTIGLAPADGSLSHEEYKRTIHPHGQVPALRVGENVITEMPAVLIFIVSLAEQQGKQWLGDPKDVVERARSLSLMCWLSGAIHSGALTLAWRPLFFSDDVNAWEGIQAKGRVLAGEGFGMLEGMLRERVEGGRAGRGHVLGEEFSVLDVNVYLYYVFAKRLGVEGMDERFPFLGEVVVEVEARESTREVMKIEGQPLFTL